MIRVTIAPLAAALLLATQAPAQDASTPDALDLPDEIAGSEAVASAAQTIVDAGADQFLLADLIGSEVTGPTGEVLGTIEDLAAIPGGRLVAVLMSLEDGTPIAVPYQAMKLQGASDAAGMVLDLDAETLRGMPELRDLAEALGG